MQMFLFALVLVTVAVLVPFGLRFDGAGMRGMMATARRKVVLFTTMALMFGIGFVGLGAAGAGALIGVDGLAVMMTLWAVWLPALLISTLLASRRYAL